MRNKYNNKETWLYGERFDSKHEAERYMVLRQMQRNGEIFNLKRQVKFELVPKQKAANKTEQSVTYVADFTYTKADGTFVVEDAKGMKKGTAYAVFVIKRKLMLWIHHIAVKEV